jgi:glycosyltransferase involved in cell wall biosynthesis
MLEQITPLILTYNEAPNLARTLEPLRWAREIVVVDSFSDDETLAIAARFSQVRVFQRKFDVMERQWNYALQETGIQSEWVLALDADYVVTPELVEELKALAPPPDVSGYQARFTYCIGGRPLRGSAYPPVTVLYRRNKAVYCQDGHTQRVIVTGEVRDLQAHIRHDDRKPLSRWFRSQDAYAQQEADKLAQATSPGFNDRLRRLRWLAPFLVFFYCLFVQRNILDGRAGLFYAFQRMLAETMLSLRLLEQDLGAATERDS